MHILFERAIESAVGPPLHVWQEAISKFLSETHLVRVLEMGALYEYLKQNIWTAVAVVVVITTVWMFAAQFEKKL